MPKPPERVDRMNANKRSSVLNRCIRICRCSGRVLPSRRQYAYPYRFRNCSKISSILVICVKMSTLCPPDFSRRRSAASACSFPQSNCTSRRSGKKSCPRTSALRSGASAGNATRWHHASRAFAVNEAADETDALVIVGAGARALGMANANAPIASAASSARRAGVFTSSKSAGAETKAPAPLFSAAAWQSRAAKVIVTARRQSAPYTGTRHAAAAALAARRSATARRSARRRAARASKNKDAA